MSQADEKDRALPPTGDRELTDEELDKVAGGVWGLGTMASGARATYGVGMQILKSNANSKAEVQNDVSGFR